MTGAIKMPRRGVAAVPNPSTERPAPGIGHNQPHLCVVEEATRIISEHFVLAKSPWDLVRRRLSWASHREELEGFKGAFLVLLKEREASDALIDYFSSIADAYIRGKAPQLPSIPPEPQPVVEEPLADSGCERGIGDGFNHRHIPPFYSGYLPK